MKNKILSIVTIVLVTIMLGATNIYAEGANVSLSSNTVKAGETVELYINLSTESVGYDIKVNTNSSLIESAELVNKIGEGNTSRIYLVQLSAQRTIYSSGTRIATIKYKVSNNAKEGDKITINVSGDIAGKNSSEKNTMNESLTLSVVGEDIKQENSTNTDNKETPVINNENIINKEEVKPSPVAEDTTTEVKNETKQAENTSSKTDKNDIITNSTIPTASTVESKDATKKETKKTTGTLPKAGSESIVLYAIPLVIVIQAIMIVRAVRTRKM